MSYLISLIILFLPAYLVRFSIFGIPTTALEILIYAVLIVGLWQAYKTGFKSIQQRIWLPVILLLISLMISVAIAPDKRMALGEAKGFFIDPLLVGWLVYQYINKDNILSLFESFALVGLFVSLHAILQKITGYTTLDGRVIGIFEYSPNYMALFLAPIAVGTIAYGSSIIVKKNLTKVVISYLLSAITLLAIYFSGSRGGLLAVGAGVGIFVIAYYWGWIRKSLSAKIIISILILMAIYTSWTFFQPNFQASPTDGGRVVTSNNLRWQIWGTTIELGAKHPILGVGLGNYQFAFYDLTKDRANFPEYITPMALTAHNIFLMFWLSTGILGLLSFIWLLVLFYKKILKNIYENNFSVILLSVMTTIVVYGLVEASIWKNDLSIIFWVIWGLAWVI